MFSDASFISYATSKRRQVFGDIYNYEKNYSFISSSTIANSLQTVLKASILHLITFITPLPQTQVSSRCADLHQPAEDEEIPFLGGVDEVEQTLCGVDAFCEETAAGRRGELLFRFL
jgi:hypothetical protein